MSSYSSSSSPMPSNSSSSSYWCYCCGSFVRIHSTSASISCPDCGGGFLEEAAPTPPIPTRRRRATTGNRSPFNPVIVLRGPPDHSDRAAAAAAFELYYDDGAGMGLRPLPSSVSDFLMGSGFDRLLDQLSQLELTGATRAVDNPPASKAAIESMPVIEISDSHVGAEAHCAICKEAFELNAEVKEMPCKHLYHQGCILPWLSIRNSCPVCRHELPADQRPASEDDSESVGLTIWRLPGGGFAVGQFSGGRRPGQRELPVVYTEMDGGFNVGNAPRRVSWASTGSRSRQSGGVARAIETSFHSSEGQGRGHRHLHLLHQDHIQSLAHLGGGAEGEWRKPQKGAEQVGWLRTAAKGGLRGGDVLMM